MRMKRKAAGLLAGLMLIGTLSGCTAEKGFNYSEGLDEDGRWTEVNALDYVTLPEYVGIEVPEQTHTVTQEAIDEQVQKYLDAYPVTKQILDRAVEDGDTVNIDYVGSVDGVEFEGGSTQGNGTDVIIGTTNYIDDFLEQLIGHKPGETFDVEVTFPEDYSANPDLSGKDAVFVVTINYIAEETAPELTDEFVQTNLTEQYGWENVEQMLAQLEEDLRWSACAEYIWNAIVEGSQITELPQSMVDYQFNRMLEEYKQMAEGYGMSDDQALTLAQVSSEEELREKYIDDLESMAKDELILQAVADDADIHVTEEDVASYFKTYLYLDDYSSYEENFGKEYLRRVALNSRVLEYLVDNAVMA